MNQIGNQSTITGLSGGGAGVSSHYVPVTQAAAQNIMNKYGTLPGGLTIEGEGADLSFVRSVKFLSKQNAFVINDDIVYIDPISSGEFLEIYRALQADDKLGVSLDTYPRVFGALNPQSKTAWNLLLTDRFLGNIGFGRIGFIGNGQTLTGYKWMPGHLDLSRWGLVSAHIVFTFRDFQFASLADGELSRSNMSLDSTLVPASEKKGPDGKVFPDYESIAKGTVQSSGWVANLKNLQDNFSYYARERLLRTVIGYGEVASFVRAMKKNNVSLELD